MCRKQPVAEFRSGQDDAWYAVKLAVQGQTLLVSYADFPDEEGESFRAADFKTMDEIEALEKRFRATSHQFQDQECPTIHKDTIVCAACSFDNGDLKFFDAAVAKVTNKKHGLDENGEERCCCDFEVLWQHGGHQGMLTSTNIGGLSKISSYNKLDPTLTDFIKTSKQCFGVNVCQISLPLGPSSSKNIIICGLPSSSNRFFHKKTVGHSNQSSTTLSKGTPTCNLGSSSRRIPSCNHSLSSKGIVDQHHGLSPNDHPSSRKIPYSCFHSSSRGISIPRRVSFAQEVEVIHCVNLSSGKNDAESERVELRTCDSSSRGIAVNNSNSLSKRALVSNPSSFEDITDYNTNQPSNEVGASRRIAVHYTGSYPKDMETVQVNKESMQGKGYGASGHDLKCKINWQEWILEQRGKRKYKCAVRTVEGRRDGLCKKNRRGKLEIRLG